MNPVPVCPGGSESVDKDQLSRLFGQYFDVVRADTDELVDIAHQIRYEVYCRELKFESAEDHPDGRERDEFDYRSVHCLLRHRSSQRFVGCVRLILADLQAPEKSFPFEKFCYDSINIEFIDPARLSRLSFGEISRLAIIADFRRRLGEQTSPEGIGDDSLIPDQSDGRRVLPHISLGLYFAVAAVALEHELNSVFVMMEPRLARAMQRYGIKFRQIGDIVDYHGMRGPFHLTRNQLLEDMAPELRSLFEAIQRSLDQADNQSGTSRTLR